MSNDYSVKAHAKALLKGPTAKMDEATRREREGEYALGLDHGEQPRRGFPGGGAQSSAIQPADLLTGAALSGPTLAKAAGTALDTWADSRGLAQLYSELAKQTPKLGTLGGKVGRFAVAPGEAGQAAKSAEFLAKESEPALATRAREVWKALSQPGYKTPAAREAGEARGLYRHIEPEIESVAQNTPSAPAVATKAAGVVGIAPDKARRWLENHAAGKPAGEFVQPEQVQAHAAVLKHFTDLAGGAK